MSWLIDPSERTAAIAATLVFTEDMVPKLLTQGFAGEPWQGRSPPRSSSTPSGSARRWGGNGVTIAAGCYPNVDDCDYFDLSFASAFGSH
jgi:hypothetical protein